MLHEFIKQTETIFYIPLQHTCLYSLITHDAGSLQLSKCTNQNVNRCTHRWKIGRRAGAIKHGPHKWKAVASQPVRWLSNIRAPLATFL